MKDVLPAPLIQYRCWALPRVVCGLGTGSALCCKLLTLLNVIARRQSAGITLPTDHPLVMWIIVSWRHKHFSGMSRARLPVRDLAAHARRIHQ